MYFGVLNSYFAIFEAGLAVMFLFSMMTAPSWFLLALGFLSVLSDGMWTYEDVALYYGIKYSDFVMLVAGLKMSLPSG